MITYIQTKTHNYTIAAELSMNKTAVKVINDKVIIRSNSYNKVNDEFQFEQ